MHLVATDCVVLAMPVSVRARGNTGRLVRWPDRTQEAQGVKGFIEHAAYAGDGAFPTRYYSRDLDGVYWA